MENQDTASRVRRQMQNATQHSARLDDLASFGSDASQQVRQSGRSKTFSHPAVRAQNSHPHDSSPSNSREFFPSVNTRENMIQSTIPRSQLGRRVSSLSIPVSNSGDSFRNRMTQDVLPASINPRKRIRDSSDTDALRWYQVTSPPAERSISRPMSNLRERYERSVSAPNGTYTGYAGSNDDCFTSQPIQGRSVGPESSRQTSHTHLQMPPQLIQEMKELSTEAPRLPQQTIRPRPHARSLHHAARDQPSNVSASVNFGLGIESAITTSNFSPQARRVEPVPIRPIDFCAGKRHGAKRRKSVSPMPRRDIAITEERHATSKVFEQASIRKRSTFKRFRQQCLQIPRSTATKRNDTRQDCERETALTPRICIEDKRIQSPETSISVPQYVFASKTTDDRVSKNDESAGPGNDGSARLGTDGSARPVNDGSVRPTTNNGSSPANLMIKGRELAEAPTGSRHTKHNAPPTTESISMDFRERLETFMTTVERKFAEFTEEAAQEARKKEVAYKNTDRMLSVLNRDIRSIVAHSQNKPQTSRGKSPVRPLPVKSSVNVRAGQATKKHILDKAEAVIRKRLAPHTRRLDREYRSVTEASGHDYNEEGAKAYIEQGLKRWMETTREKAAKKADAQMTTQDAALDNTDAIEPELSTNALDNPPTSAVDDQYILEPMKQRLVAISRMNRSGGFLEASSAKLSECCVEDNSERESAEETDDDVHQSLTREDSVTNDAPTTGNGLSDWQRYDGAPTIDRGLVDSEALALLSEGCDRLDLIPSDMSLPATQMVNEYFVKRRTKVGGIGNEAIVLQAFYNLEEANCFAQDEMSKVRWSSDLMYTSRVDEFNARGHFMGKVVLDSDPVRAEHVWVSCEVHFVGELADFSLRKMKRVLPLTVYFVEVITRAPDNLKAARMLGVYSILDLANKAAADHISDMMRPKTNDDQELEKFERYEQVLRDALQQSYDEELPLDISHDDKDGQFLFQVEVKEMTVQGPLN